MGTHPSKKFENGVLVERALSTDVAGDPVEQNAHTEEGHRLTSPLSEKRVAAAENKAMKKATKKASKS
jgi:hypothetical protein